MEENEGNENCMCQEKGEQCKYIPQGINAAFGYNTAVNLMDDMNCSCNQENLSCEQNRNRIRNEMMKQIKCLNFAVVDISEYLDTHPDDRKAICLHSEYCNRLKEIKDKYQKIFGPLDIYYPCNKWRWLEEPWPWEGSDF